MIRGPSGDGGNALLEFTYLAVLLMVPVVYLLLTVFQVQSAAFAVTEAARQAGRAFVRAPDESEATRRAGLAAGLALQDQGLQEQQRPRVSCPDPAPCLTPGTRVRVTVEYRVRLLFLGALFGRSQAPSIPVTATHEQTVDSYQAGP